LNIDYLVTPMGKASGVKLFADREAVREQIHLFQNKHIDRDKYR